MRHAQKYRERESLKDIHTKCKTHTAQLVDVAWAPLGRFSYLHS